MLNWIELLISIHILMMKKNSTITFQYLNQGERPKKVPSSKNGDFLMQINIWIVMIKPFQLILNQIIEINYAHHDALNLG